MNQKHGFLRHNTAWHGGQEAVEKGSGPEEGKNERKEHLLVAALHGAVALKEVHGAAVAVRKDLHLDVPRPLDVAL
jgi:hypothetical protein